MISLVADKIQRMWLIVANLTGQQTGRGSEGAIVGSSRGLPKWKW